MVVSKCLGMEFFGEKLPSKSEAFAIVFNFVGNLASIYVDAAVNGEGVAWLSLNV